MKVHEERLAVSTRGRAFHDITAQVQRIVDAAGVRSGLCNVFVQHTSASLVIQENADPSVRRDLERWIARICPERTSEVIPVSGGRLALGTWQGIYLWEHRRTPHTRHVVVHVQGV